MLFPRRYLIISIFFLILLAIYYLYSIWSLAGLYSGRTFQGRMLGVMGLLFIIAAFFSGARCGQDDTGKPQVWYPWHLLLGSLSICVILAHAGFRFGNLMATFAFFFLLGVVTSGFLIVMFDRHIARLAQNAQETHARLAHLRQRCTSIHKALTAGLMAFVLVHILSILYY